MCDPSRVPTASPGRARSVAARTVVGDIGHLEAFAAVAFIGFELDPELAGARGEGDRPLVGLAGLVGGDRCGRGWGRGHAVGPHLAVLPPVGRPALPSASAPTPVPTHPSEALRLVSLPLLQEASLPAPAPPPRVPTPRCWNPPMAAPLPRAVAASQGQASCLHPGQNLGGAGQAGWRPLPVGT